ncbi:MAG: hypothetical protein IE909_12765 [Campylobacterales bacterium]|nr:hypothetical protein [Campylobacterales bacterium]
MSKKELCIVHIGMPKTGSSTLQDTFYEIIEDKRVSYGNLPEANQSGRFAGLFIDKPENYHYFSNRGWNREQIENFNQKNRELLIQGFLNSDSSIELISGEDLFHLQKNEIEKMKQFLSSYFHKIVIVAYVRPVKSFIEPAFQQLVKYHDFNTFDFSMIYHQYKNFKSYDDVFGIENVLLWKFEPANFPEGDIVLDFCQKLDLQPMRAKQKIVNESLSKEAVSILFVYHFHKRIKSDFGIFKVRVDYTLVEVLRPIGSSKLKFSGKLINKVLETYREDYEWIQQRMQDSLKENIDVNGQEGINNEHELMEYATLFINDLVNLVGVDNVDFELVKNPQTVAKLVNLLAVKIYNEIPK